MKPLIYAGAGQVRTVAQMRGHGRAGAETGHPTRRTWAVGFNGLQELGQRPRRAPSGARI